jgi:hypothetical protein
MLNPEKVLTSFFDGNGRLKQIPVKKAKREIVMDRLAAEFVVGRHYPEAVVNRMLLRFHDDFATIRRELVDTGRMQRAQNVYWRTPDHE